MQSNDFSDKLKKKICSSKELGHEFLVVVKLTLKAIDNKDIELWNRMDKKRKEIIYKIMDNIEDIKNDITDNQYLNLCNCVKELF